MLPTLWLALLLIGLAGASLHDRRSYAAFKQLTDSADRRRAFGRWTVQSFVLMAGAAIVTALVLRVDLPLRHLPAAFRPIADGFKGPPSDGGSDHMVGTVIGLTMGVGLGVLVQAWRMRRALAAMIGDVEALIPRNARERLAAIPLCLNAGFSEELLFRLALPLLIARVTGSAVVGLVAAAIVFGLVHAYQGWKGVLGTTLLGGLLTLMYLSSGSLLRPMVAHAVLDLLALIVRPWLAARLAGWMSRRNQPALAGAA